MPMAITLFTVHSSCPPGTRREHKSSFCLAFCLCYFVGTLHITKLNNMDTGILHTSLSCLLTQSGG